MNPKQATASTNKFITLELLADGTFSIVENRSDSSVLKPFDEFLRRSVLNMVISEVDLEHALTIEDFQKFYPKKDPTVGELSSFFRSVGSIKTETDDRNADPEPQPISCRTIAPSLRIEADEFIPRRARNSLEDKVKLTNLMADSSKSLWDYYAALENMLDSKERAAFSMSLLLHAVSKDLEVMFATLETSKAAEASGVPAKEVFNMAIDSLNVQKGAFMNTLVTLLETLRFAPDPKNSKTPSAILYQVRSAMMEAIVTGQEVHNYDEFKTQDTDDYEAKAWLYDHNMTWAQMDNIWEYVADRCEDLIEQGIEDWNQLTPQERERVLITYHNMLSRDLKWREDRFWELCSKGDLPSASELFLNRGKKGGEAGET